MQIHSQVSVSYIKVLVEEDAKHDLKLAPHLKPKHLDGTHYDKMNVSCAVAVLNHAVAAGIKYLVEARKLPEKALTTAWFLEQVHRWFTLITSRSFSVAMSKAKENKHDEAVTFLKGFMKLFQNLNIRKAGQADAFKPVQAGVLITTASAIHLQKKLLEEYKFRFVLLSRLSQDAQKTCSLLFGASILFLGHLNSSRHSALLLSHSSSTPADMAAMNMMTALTCWSTLHQGHLFSPPLKTRFLQTAPKRKT